jgi:hypothetical protein
MPASAGDSRVDKGDPLRPEERGTVMPSGERSQVWYPSVVALLRSQWRTDMTWEGAIKLRALLQRERPSA